ncbi:uncharacterized protein FFB20_05313 [Fusarium fujikuroi]|uniref:Uncharacterized protein n=1 Tax=Fusarium fujikuroi TaxID=5127 RepID=A0A9Q9U5P6_FUSFU|nr:uncharacterized protein FFB20_05313 [Fusarium fujikuroi]VTT58665.1 unnamed protein product [Fusarium fujikuroi]
MSDTSTSDIFADFHLKSSTRTPSREQQRSDTFALIPKFSSMSECVSRVEGVVAPREILRHLEVMLCAEEEDLRRAVHSPVFRNNSTKYLGACFKVCDPNLLPHEPGFWLDGVNNAPDEILITNANATAADTNSDSGESTDSIDSQSSDGVPDIWYPVDGYGVLEQRWKQFSRAVLENAVTYGGYVRDPLHENINAQCAEIAPFAALLLNMSGANVTPFNNENEGGTNE